MMRHITIYQIEDIANVDYAYRSFDKNKFNFNDYKKVYEFDMDCTDMLYTEILEECFYIFNMKHPKDYRGRSLSMSDIVFIDDKGYYCDAFAWSNVTM